MTTTKRYWLATILLVLSTQVNAQGAPSDLELRAAYCLGVARYQYSMMSAWSHEDPDPDCKLRISPDYPTMCQKTHQSQQEGVQTITRDMQHLQSYLLSKGFKSSDGSSPEALAFKRGQADMTAAMARTQTPEAMTCFQSCYSAQLSGEACNRRCMPDTDGTLAKIERCPDVAKGLPF